MVASVPQIELEVEVGRGWLLTLMLVPPPYLLPCHPVPWVPTGLVELLLLLVPGRHLHRLLLFLQVQEAGLPCGQSGAPEPSGWVSARHVVAA